MTCSPLEVIFLHSVILNEALLQPQVFASFRRFPRVAIEILQIWLHLVDIYLKQFLQEDFDGCAFSHCHASVCLF